VGQVKIYNELHGLYGSRSIVGIVKVGRGDKKCIHIFGGEISRNAAT
jgi:hypothetical protein